MPTIYFSDDDHETLRHLSTEADELTGRKDGPAGVVMELVRLHADEHLRRLRIAEAVKRGQAQERAHEAARSRKPGTSNA